MLRSNEMKRGKTLFSKFIRILIILIIMNKWKTRPNLILFIDYYMK